MTTTNKIMAGMIALLSIIITIMSYTDMVRTELETVQSLLDAKGEEHCLLAGFDVFVSQTHTAVKCGMTKTININDHDYNVLDFYANK